MSETFTYEDVDEVIGSDAPKHVKEIVEAAWIDVKALRSRLDSAESMNKRYESDCRTQSDLLRSGKYVMTTLETPEPLALFIHAVENRVNGLEAERDEYTRLWAREQGLRIRTEDESGVVVEGSPTAVVPKGKLQAAEAQRDEAQQREADR